MALQNENDKRIIARKEGWSSGSGSNEKRQTLDLFPGIEAFNARVVEEQRWKSLPNANGRCSFFACSLFSPAK